MSIPLLFWENDRAKSQVLNYPKIIEFLGCFSFNIDTTTLSGRIIKYQYGHDLSQEDFANLLNVNESTVFHYESDTHAPKQMTFEKLEWLVNQKKR